MTANHGKFDADSPERHELYLLVGADMRMTEYWCEERQIRRTEIGRTVFCTSMDEHVLRGRIGPITLVFAPDDHRPWTDRDLSLNERAHIGAMVRGAHFINRTMS